MSSLRKPGYLIILFCLTTLIGALIYRQWMYENFLKGTYREATPDFEVKDYDGSWMFPSSYPIAVMSQGNNNQSKIYIIMTKDEFNILKPRLKNYSFLIPSNKITEINRWLEKPHQSFNKFPSSLEVKQLKDGKQYIHATYEFYPFAKSHWYIASNNSILSKYTVYWIGGERAFIGCILTSFFANTVLWLFVFFLFRCTRSIYRRFRFKTIQP